MSRDPSLHIKKSELVRVISTLLPYNVDAESFTTQLMFRCLPYSVSTRSVVASTQRIEAKADKITKSTRFDSDMLSKLIYATRQRLKHRGISPIKAGSKEWDTLKEITSQALSFCNEFNIPKREGMIKYIEIGISRMSTFNINKFPSMHEAICKSYEALAEIEQDDDPKFTEVLYKIYSTYIMKQTGIFEDFKNDYEKYVFFVRARKQAKELNIALEDYMQAQFDGLDFVKGIPHPSQLSGAKANERLYKYLFKHGLKISK